MNKFTCERQVSKSNLSALEESQSDPSSASGPRLPPDPAPGPPLDPASRPRPDAAVLGGNLFANRVCAVEERACALALAGRRRAV